jgi:hypothetical protein
MIASSLTIAPISRLMSGWLSSVVSVSGLTR